MRWRRVVLLLVAVGAACVFDEEPPIEEPKEPPPPSSAECDPCPEGQLCSAGQCVQAPGGDCEDRSQCAVGQQCANGHCIEGPEACEQDRDCGRDQRCSLLGRCFLGECLIHRDCTTNERCRDQRCLERPTPAHGILFERREVAPFNQHSSFDSSPADRGAANGWGGGLVDVDGDGLQDVFLGRGLSDAQPSSPPCLYRNRARGTELVFEAEPSLCHQDLGKVFAAYGLDLEGDGLEEMILLGRETIQFHRFAPQREQAELRTLLEPDDPRHYCEAGAALIFDMDHDGDLDLYVGCQMRAEGAGGRPLPPIDQIMANLTFLQGPAGAFERAPADLDRLLANPGSTLALAGADLNDDGLLDMVLLNDAGTYLGAPVQLGEFEPGRVFMACSPLEDCRYRPEDLGEGAEAYGSFMGAALLHIDGIGEHLFVSDLGPNRLFALEQPRRDQGPDRGLRLAYSGETMLYAWSALNEDFDRNGLDDVFVTHGALGPEFESVHEDLLLLQQPGGTFVAMGAEVGLVQHNREDAQQDGPLWSARGAAKVDLDHDGALDLITVPLNGLSILQSEVSAQGALPRCSVKPRPSLVPSSGLGYRVRALAGGPWRRRDVQGELRFGLPHVIMVSEGAGTLRFPSGAERDFDCEGQPGPVEVEEGDWLVLNRVEDRLEVVMDSPWWPAETMWDLAVASRDGLVRSVACRSTASGCSATLLPDDERVMLRRDGTAWIPRWLSVSGEGL